MRGRRHPKRLPHVHHCKANTCALLLAEPGVELRHARFRSVLAAKPDRPAPHKIADHDPIGMTLADRNLVDPDRSEEHTSELQSPCNLVCRLLLEKKKKKQKQKNKKKKKKKKNQ